jgi:hypothetical protein
MKVEEDKQKGPLSSSRQYWTPHQIMAEFGIGRTLVYDLIRDRAFGVTKL